MKLYLVVGAYLVLLLGGSAALFWHQLETFGAPEAEYRMSDQIAAGGGVRPEELSPIAELAEAEYDFGSAKNGTEGLEHAFVVRNRGVAPLRITHYTPSCGKCTEVLSGPLEIAPGDEGEVLVRWKLDRKPQEREFRQSVKIHTDDPGHRILEAYFYGRILHSLVASPEQLTFGSINPRDGAKAEVSLQAFFDTDLQIVSHSFADPSTASSFDVSFEPIAAEKLEASAKSGQKMVVKIKPGLPLGAFRQALRLETNLPDAPMLEVSIQGQVRDDRFSLAGGKWLTRGVVGLGGFKRSEGAHTTINLFLNGPGAKDVVFGTPRATVEFIQVAVKNTKPLGEDRTTSQIEIRIAPDAGSGNYSGTDVAPPAEIVIPTGSPEFGDIKIKVEFAVEG